MKFDNIVHSTPQAAECVKRGFTFAKSGKWCDAKNEFEKAAKINPDCGMYRFYIMYAETDGLTVPFRVYVNTGFLDDALMELDREYKGVLKALNKEERAILKEDFGLDFVNELSLKASLVPYFLTDIEVCGDAGFDVNLRFLNNYVYDLDEEEELAQKAAELICNWCLEKGYLFRFRDLFEWAIQYCPEKKKEIKAIIKNGVMNVLFDHNLPIDENGVLKINDESIHCISFFSADSAKAASLKVKKFILTPNIKNIISAGFTCPVVEIDPSCNMDESCKVAVSIATTAIIVPKGASVTVSTMHNAFYYSEGAIHNNTAWVYPSSGRTGYSGAVMGRAMFPPIFKNSFGNKYGYNDYDVAKFKEKLLEFFGKDGLKKKKLKKVEPEKQYDKARKINKEK